MPNIKVINKLVRLWGGSVMPDCQPLFKALKWLTLPGILRFDHLFRVAQFGRIGGSLCSGLVAQYGPDYSPPLKLRSLIPSTTRLFKHSGNNGITIISVGLAKFEWCIL